MIKNKIATSIIEAMVVMLLVVAWITGMYNLFFKSIKLSDWTENKLHAIQIAKQGIEGFTNIRDTNYLRFSSDTENCWNTLNYDGSCIWANNTTHEIVDDWIYKIYRENNEWKLEKVSSISWDYKYYNHNYRTLFKIWLDSNWFYTQNWWTELKPLFTREIKTDYDWNDKLEVTSLVQWVDSSSKEIRKVELNKVLTNWKK